MFCVKCGNELKDGTKFCTKCGAPVSKPVSSPSNQEIPTEKKVMPPTMPIDDNTANAVSLEPEKKKGNAGLKIFSIIALLLVVFGLIFACMYLFVFSGDDKSEKSFEGQLKKAEEMMEKEKYEEAIGYYKAILEDAPEEVEVYKGLAEAYMAQNKIDEAIKVLETGHDVTKSDDLQELIEKFRKKKDEQNGNQEQGGDTTTETSVEETVESYAGEKKDVNIEVRQVDNSDFPEITMYVSVTDVNGETVKELEGTDFDIQEIDANGNVIDATIGDVYQVLNQDKISVNLVLDSSGSMDSSNKMQQAKNAANALIDQMELEKGDQVEIISFDDFVYLEQDFSSQSELLKEAINGINTKGSTALYDGLYAGLFQTYYEDGAKCVIGFTDGMENASSYTFDDVVSMAQNTGIPVFIIGIGEEYDAVALQNLASQCSGKYYSANVNDLETILEDIYISIYHEQQDYYVVKYTTTNLDNPTQFRDVVLETSDTTEFRGSYRKSYVPQTDITGAFSAAYMNLDYILDFSSQRSVTEADLAGLGLAELRIARNEIFARHGRQFKDSMLNQWFYSKVWYLNIPAKFSPTDFDAMNPSPLSRLEIDNANFIKEYENNIMSNQDIYPNAGSVLLSDYDLALSKAVLKNALNQINTYPSTSILEENKRLIQEAINKEEVQY